MTTRQRKIICSTLLNVSSFKSKDVKILEEYIFKMCKELSNMYDDSLEQIYAKFAFEKVGQLISQPEKQKEIILDLKNKVLEWDSVVYNDFREKEERDTADQAAGMKVTKGEFKCGNFRCRSDECYYYQEQTRSCDEPPCTRVVCTKCGHRYSFS